MNTNAEPLNTATDQALGDLAHAVANLATIEHDGNWAGITTIWPTNGSTAYMAVRGPADITQVRVTRRDTPIGLMIDIAFALDDANQAGKTKHSNHGPGSRKEGK